MASPMVEGRSPRVLDPHKKAHFSLHISDRISSPSARPSYTSVKYNHKPAQTTSTRTTTLKSASSDRYNLKLEDGDDEEGSIKDIFVFQGQKTAPKKQYVLIFDPSTQTATLEPLASTYTFNVAKKNSADVSQQYTKIYPKRPRTDSQSQDTVGGSDDLFDQSGTREDDGEPDPNNPYDFRHFLRRGAEKRGDESEYAIPSSPDYRTGTGSAMNTPVFQARRPASTHPSKPKALQLGRKRKSPEPMVSKKATTKKPPPTVRLERKASTRPPADPPTKRKTASKPSAPPSSKIKSAEIIEDSDSDLDAPASPDLVSSPPMATHSPPRRRRSPTPESEEEQNTRAGAGSGGGGLEIEVPDARPNAKPKALASLGLGQAIGLGGLSHLRSPASGPISLASAANSVEGSPNPQYLASRKGGRQSKQDDDVIDFGSYGAGGRGDDDEEDADGEDDEEFEDRDVPDMDIGPPAAVQRESVAGRKMSMAGLPIPDEDEEDPLYKEMIEGLADSSEESEEE
ncbi:RNA polymerase II transcription elongation factor-domain-containing protein [Lophiotrema nucula]|uniref:RNA polymerase II transcription elongation factor-domain-containing protein n=1 Tax=Lophiotrema nucula TaxID=690887 RepID=A0A6A5ZM62_9PLEO|nr:RNA polymerase II transcription elongation factor-domain-containing protein [Lophiotrema nucula]